jgi:hypothetical protein
METEIEIAANGNLRLLSSLPDWLKPGRAHVLLTAEDAAEPKRKRQITQATLKMMARRMAALEKVRDLNPCRDVIDPVEWQRKIHRHQCGERCSDPGIF